MHFISLHFIGYCVLLWLLSSNEQFYRIRYVTLNGGLVPHLATVNVCCVQRKVLHYLSVVPHGNLLVWLA